MNELIEPPLNGEIHEPYLITARLRLHCERAEKSNIFRGDYYHELAKDALAEIERLQKLPRLSEIPEGYILFPERPTDRMITAAWIILRRRWPFKSPLGPGPGFKEAMLAMIEARPIR